MGPCLKKKNGMVQEESCTDIRASIFPFNEQLSLQIQVAPGQIDRPPGVWEEEGARVESIPEEDEGSDKRHSILTKETTTFKAFSLFVGRGKGDKFSLCSPG